MTAGFQASAKLITPFPVNHQLACPTLITQPAPPLRILIAQHQVVKDAWILFPCSTMLVLKPQQQAYSRVATQTAQHSTISLPTSGKIFTLLRKMCLAQLYQGSTLLDSQYRQWLSPSLIISFRHSTPQSIYSTKLPLLSSRPTTACFGVLIAMWLVKICYSSRRLHAPIPFPTATSIGSYALSYHLDCFSFSAAIPAPSFEDAKTSSRAMLLQNIRKEIAQLLMWIH